MVRDYRDKPLETAELREAIYQGQNLVDWIDSTGGWGAEYVGVRIKPSMLRALVAAAKETANRGG